MICSDSANLDTWLHQAKEEIMEIFVQSHNTDGNHINTWLMTVNKLLAYCFNYIPHF
jgi:hypothetical protein